MADKNLTIRLTRSLSGRSANQIATANSLGLKKIGKIAKISHLVAVTEA